MSGESLRLGWGMRSKVAARLVEKTKAWRPWSRAVDALPPSWFQGFDAHWFEGALVQLLGCGVNEASLTNFTHAMADLLATFHDDRFECDPAAATITRAGSGLFDPDTVHFGPFADVRQVPMVVYDYYLGHSSSTEAELLDRLMLAKRELASPEEVDRLGVLLDALLQVDPYPSCLPPCEAGDQASESNNEDEKG